MEVNSQHHAPAALTPGNNPGIHWIEECVGPPEPMRAIRRTNNSLDLAGFRTPYHRVRSLVTTLFLLLNFHIKEALRTIRDNSNRAHLKDITACLVIINQKANRMAARSRLISSARALTSWRRIPQATRSNADVLCVSMLWHLGRLAHWPGRPKNAYDSSQCCWSRARPMQWDQ